jgi:PAS domain S-box-containing protein
MYINISDDIYGEMEDISSILDLAKEDIIQKALKNFHRKVGSIQPQATIPDLQEADSGIQRKSYERPSTVVDINHLRTEYHDLFFHLTDCVYLLDFTGNFLDINDTALSVIGYSRDEILSKKINEISQDERIALFFKNIEKINLNSFKERVIECKVCRKDRKIIDIQARISIVFRDNKPYALLGIAHDITKLKKIEYVLKNTEEKFYKTFHINPYPIVIATVEEGRFIDVNNAFLSAFKYEKNEIRSKNVFDLGIWQNLNERNGIKLNLYQVPGFQNKEIMLFTSDKKLVKCDVIIENVELEGEKCWVFIFKSILEFDETGPDSFSGSQKTGKNGMTGSSNFLPPELYPEKNDPDMELFSRSVLTAKKLLDAIEDGIMIIDENNTIVNMNKSAENILGCSFSRAINRPYSEVFGFLEPDNSFKERIRKGININKEVFRIKNFDNKIISVNCTAFVLHDKRGHYKGFTCGLHKTDESENNKPEKPENYSFQGMVSKNPAMLKIFKMLPDIALSDSPVLLEGPTGTGKNSLAKAIHNLSGRKNKSFMLIHCGTVPVELFESELFGHTRGAFTDAKYNKLGKIAAAEGGTVFFDEIGDLPYSLQIKLLRLIEDHEYESIGSTKTVFANIRIISATNKNLLEYVNKNSFRADLYYRLSTVKLYSPGLKERKEDIPHLIDFFINKYNAKSGKSISAVSEDVFKILIEYDFPGNIRELSNIFEYAFINCKKNIISISDLPSELLQPDKDFREEEPSEKSKIIQVLNKHNGNKIKACKELNISYATLFRKIKKYNLNV